MRSHRLDRVPQQAKAGIRRLRSELDLPVGFSDEVLAQARQLRRNPPDTTGYTDLTRIDFVTIDPASSQDLDQALQIERTEDGYLVRYAIADVGYWVKPGSALDEETHRRGETYYAPGARVPLHPAELSEDAASLLADDRPRPAIVWSIQLDAQCQVLDTTLTRALVVNRAKLSYAEVQRDLDQGRAHPSIELLPEVGRLRELIERERGGINLKLPEQEIVEEDGHWRLTFRQLHPVEGWNAQISLLTGFEAARIQLAAGIGILRTLPPAEDYALARLRRQARAIGVEWPENLSYPEFVRNLNPAEPQQLAVMMKCTLLFRGAGYLCLGAAEGNLIHSALGAEYAHTTAPLRRLVDRYTLEVCLALANGEQVPNWVLAQLPKLPATMRESGQRANAYERGVLGIAEALVLNDRVGEIFSGVLVDVKPKTKRGLVQIADPAVELPVAAEASDLGKEIKVRIEDVDLLSGEVSLSEVD